MDPSALSRPSPALWPSPVASPVTQQDEQLSSGCSNPQNPTGCSKRGGEPLSLPETIWSPGISGAMGNQALSRLNSMMHTENKSNDAQGKRRGKK